MNEVLELQPGYFLKLNRLIHMQLADWLSPFVDVKSSKSSGRSVQSQKNLDGCIRTKSQNVIPLSHEWVGVLYE